MKKIVTTALVFIIVQIINAQRTIDGLIKAEKDFAAYSVANSTKEAFLKFLDSAGLIFDNGKAVNGIETWNKREKRPGILNWRPQFAGIAASNDFGYTTGPWTFQPTEQDSVIARGQYTTVWHVDKNGQWKFLVDLGVSNTPLNTDTSLDILKSNYKPRPGSLQSLLDAENKFIEAAGDSATRAYKKFLGTAVVSRNEIGVQYAWWKPGTFTDSIQYTINGSAIASSGDMGYVYGTTIINGKTDNYLRIWRKEDKVWKIVVEVLRY